MAEPESLILVQLREMRGEIADMRVNMATKSDVAEIRSEIKSLGADVASDMMAFDKKFSERFAGLQRAVSTIPRPLVTAC